jgi:hypothetical protein
MGPKGEPDTKKNWLTGCRQRDDPTNLKALVTSHKTTWHHTSETYNVAFFAVCKLKKKNQLPWSESASKLYRPSDRLLSAKWLPTCADRGCRVVSVTDPSGRILSVFYTGATTFLSSSSSVVLTRLSGPRSRPTTIFFSGSARNRTQASRSVANNSDH